MYLADRPSSLPEMTIGYPQEAEVFNTHSDGPSTFMSKLFWRVKEFMFFSHYFPPRRFAAYQARRQSGVNRRFPA